MDIEMNNDMHSQLQYYNDGFSFLEKIPGVSLIPASSLSPHLWHQYFFYTVSIVFAITYSHVVRTMQHVAFSDKLFLQSNKYSISIYFFLEPDSSPLLFLNNILLYGHTSLSVPNPLYWLGPVSNWAAEQEVSLNVMHLNHPETTSPTPGCGKMAFHKTSPWCQKVWDPWINLFNAF